MYPAPHDAKEQIRQAVDLVDLVGSYLPLHRQGANYVALCPWHDDHKPSLQINPARQSWKCWVCNVGGDVFSFVMQREGVDFREALEMLAQRAGIELRSTPGKKVEPGSPEDKKTLYAAMAWAEQEFHRYLLEAKDAEVARAYLQDRAISAESIQRYRIGFAPNEWQWLLGRARETRFSTRVLEAVCLTAKSPKSGRDYDFFRGRVMFPIRDTQHRCIAFGGRILPQFADSRGGKYLNTSDTRLFIKSDELYGLDIAMNNTQVARNRHLAVVEGYTDVIMANQYGVENVVAVLGTAIGTQHVRQRSLLRRHADRITLVLDGDEAGQKRTGEVLELFVAEQVDLRVATLPPGLDPCDFLQRHGAEAFQQLLDAAPDALQHKLNFEISGVDLSSDVHAANAALENVLLTIAKAPNSPTTTGSAQQLRHQQIINRISREFRIPPEQLHQRLSQLRQQNKPRPAQGNQAEADASQTSPPPGEAMSCQEKELLEIFTLKPQLAEQAIAALDVGNLRSPDAQKLFSAYRELVAAGDLPDYTRVQTELEDPRLKNLLAGLDWEAHEKAPHAFHEPEQRLESLIRFFTRRQVEEALRDVHTGQLDEDEALRRVREVIQLKRTHQGISEPTDG